MAKRSPATEEESKFEALIEEYGRLLRKAILKTCPRNLGLDINDIEQEARLKLWRALSSEKILTDPASYIYRIAVTTTIDAVRRVTARREEQLQLAEDGESEGQMYFPITDPAQSPEALAEQSQLIRKVEQAISRLQENRRLAVGLYLKGMTTEEIADLLDWSEAKARNLVYRGLKDLREELRSEGIDYSG